MFFAKKGQNESKMGQNESKWVEMGRNGSKMRFFVLITFFDRWHLQVESPTR